MVSSAGVSTRAGVLTRGATGLVALQGLALVVVGVVLGVQATTGRPSDRLGALLGAGLAVVTGIAVVLLARGLWRRRSWVRSPVTVVELLCLPVAWGLFQAHETLIGLVVGGVALLAITLVVLSTRWSGVPRELATRR